MPFFKRFLGGDRALPQRWTEILSFCVAIPLGTPDIRRAEMGIRKALKVRDALTRLCQDRYLYDDVFQSLNKKRRAGQALTTEEEQYVTQADTNYLEEVCYKMEIALLYEGAFFSLSLEERHAFHQLVEQYPGCSLVSGQQGIGDRKVYRLAPEGQLTDEQAREVLLKILR